jgi:hypothetical protein
MYGDPTAGDQAALQRRIERAVAAAVESVRRSILLRAATRNRRDGGMTTRCAWCGRFAVDGTFVDADDAPQFVRLSQARTTHGICPKCIDELRRTGRSV